MLADVSTRHQHLDQTGVMGAVCHHGFLLALAPMNAGERYASRVVALKSGLFPRLHLTMCITLLVLWSL